jgi:GT2 family glycosyltransferase
MRREFAGAISQTATLAVSLCILTHNRPLALQKAVASAAGHGFDEVLVIDQASDPPLVPIAGVRWERSAVNLGVADGRNRLVTLAHGDLVVFLDDDATLLGRGAAETLRDAFETDHRLGAVAFYVQRADGGVVSREIPFRGRPHETDRARQCAYFVGCGAAIRRSAFLGVGGFDARYGYSTEELDLALAMARAGWRLRYVPSLRIEHVPAEQGRMGAAEVAVLHWRNRILLARRHLPLAFSVPHLAVWGARTLGEAVRSGATGAWWRATWDACRIPVDRMPLTIRQAWDVHSLGGRSLW